MKLQITLMCLLGMLAMPFGLLGQEPSAELVYAEMEFPLGFVEHIQEYAFNPLARFQTQVEGRLIELTCDSLVDLYQVGRTINHRSSLGTWRPVKLRTGEVLNFNVVNVKWDNGREINFNDVWFSLQYYKTNPTSWEGNQNLNIEKRGEQSFDAYLIEARDKAPEPGEFYFPIINQDAFQDSRSPARARVNKQKQAQMGYGRYYIANIEENRSIQMKRRSTHHYYENLKLPGGYKRIDSIKMHAFPKARIARNEQFVNGRVHLITSAAQEDIGYIIHTYPEIKVSRYYDDSFTCFVFNCEHPHLVNPAVRRGLNYAFRKRLALKKILGDEGMLISGPLPSANPYYNISVHPYDDDIAKAIATWKLYRYWGLDAYEQDNKVFLFSKPAAGPAEDLESGDEILEVESTPIHSILDLITTLTSQNQKVIRVKVSHGKRVLLKRLHTGTTPKTGAWETVDVNADRLANFPELNLIANNPEGKDPIIKEICGALKEDMEKLGIKIKIDYLDALTYYPKLQNGDFDLAFRTVDITGTPNLYRMLYKKIEDDKSNNANYGNYYNPNVNEMAYTTKNVTDVEILRDMWKKAHIILNQDPPYLFLWSRRYILGYSHKLEVITPGPEYKIAHAYKGIDGVINIFNEVHLWAFKDSE